MANYCTKEQLIAQRMSESDLVTLLDDESLGAENEAIGLRLDAILKATDAQINEYLIGYWSLPLATVPDSIRTIAVDMAVYKMYHRRPGEKPKDIVTEYAHTLIRLQRMREEKIQGRDILFPPAVDKDVNVLINKTDADRVFGSSMLSKMP